MNDATTPASPSTEVQVAPPPALQAMLGGEILAAKPLDAAAGDADWIVVRRDGDDAKRCEAILLEQEGSGFEVVARNDKVVDCLYNELAQNAGDLSANLEVDGTRFTYNNQRDKGNTAYTFAFLPEKNGWFLVKALSTVPEYDPASDAMEVYREQIEDPDARKEIAFAAFDPDAIGAEMKQSRTRVE